MRRNLALLCLAASTLAAAQEPTPKVTATYAGISVGQLLADLSQKTGAHLSSTPGTAEPVIALRVTDVPLKDILDRLAKATGCEWHKEEDGLRLVRSVAAERENEIAYRQRLAKYIRAGIQKYIATVKPKATWGSDEARKLATDTETLMNPASNQISGADEKLQALMPRSPGSRAIANLLLQMDPMAFAADMDGKRHVYAMQPTRMQRPMPSGAGSILSEYLREQILFVTETTEFTNGLPANRNHFSMSGVARGVFGGGNPNLGLGQSILVISGDPHGTYASASLTITDAAGAVLCSADASLSFEREPPTKFDADPGEKAMTVPAVAAEFQKANQQSQEGVGESQYVVSNGGLTKTLTVPQGRPQREIAPSAAVTELVLNPDKMEPESISAGNELVQVAEARHLNLLANLPDNLFLNCLGSKQTPSSFLSSGNLQNDSDVTVADGWLNVQPRSLALAKIERVNRVSLAKMLRGVAAKKLLMLDDIAQFVLAQGESVPVEDIYLNYLRVLNPGAADRTYHAQDWQTYRLYGSLSLGQKKALGSGGAIPLRNLSATGFSAAENMIQMASGEPKMITGSGEKIEAYSGKVLADWTQLLPNGVPRDGVLTAKVLQNPAAYCFSSASNSAEIVSGNEFAARKFLLEAPSFHGASSVPPYDKFAPATLWNYSFTMQFTPNVGLDKSLDDGTFKEGYELGAFDGLPADLKTAIDKELGELRTVFGKVNFGGGGSSGKTPP
jgi:hypothetical protein